MLRRDLLKAQIEQMGRVLGEALTLFLKGKTNENFSDQIKFSHEFIKEKLKLDIDYLLYLSEEEFLLFIEQEKLTTEHIEHLANYLGSLGISIIENDKTKATFYLQKSLYFYQLIDQLSKTLSFERLANIKKVTNHLSEL